MPRRSLCRRFPPGEPSQHGRDRRPLPEERKPRCPHQGGSRGAATDPHSAEARPSVPPSANDTTELRPRAGGTRPRGLDGRASGRSRRSLRQRTLDAARRIAVRPITSSFNRLSTLSAGRFGHGVGTGHGGYQFHRNHRAPVPWPQTKLSSSFGGRRSCGSQRSCPCARVLKELAGRRSAHRGGRRVAVPRPTTLPEVRRAPHDSTLRPAGLEYIRVRSCVRRRWPRGRRRPPTWRRPRCSGRDHNCAEYDRLKGRRWRQLDLAGMRWYLRYDTRRVDCPRCGVVVEHVAWADVGSSFTRPFED